MFVRIEISVAFWNPKQRRYAAWYPSIATLNPARWQIAWNASNAHFFKFNILCFGPFIKTSFLHCIMMLWIPEYSLTANPDFDFLQREHDYKITYRHGWSHWLLILYFILARCSSYAECPLIINTRKRLTIALSPNNC